MDSGYRRGASHRQQIIAAFEVAAVLGKLRAAVISLAELELLDHRAHRTVKNGDAAGEELAKLAIGGGGTYFIHP